MSKPLLEYLEKAVRQRNPELAVRLRPGLSEDDIRKMLQNAGVSGDVEPVVSLFAWHDGSQPDPWATLVEASPFPESVYVFGDLATMIEHFKSFHESFVYHPKFYEVDGRYFPMFWDNSTGYLALDLNGSTHRVVLLEPESEELAREAYSSFEGFLKDAIRANEEDDILTCFQLS